MLVFLVVCGQWIEPMYDCMERSGNGFVAATCVVYFAALFLLGNVVFLGLFFALLLSSFESLKPGKISLFLSVIQGFNLFQGGARRDEGRYSEACKESRIGFASEMKSRSKLRR